MYLKRTAIHPNIFRFIEFLSKYHIQVKHEIDIQINDLSQARRKTRKIVMCDANIDLKKKQLENKIITLDEYLLAATFWSVKHEKFVMNFNFKNKQLNATYLESENTTYLEPENTSE